MENKKKYFLKEGGSPWVFIVSFIVSCGKNPTPGGSSIPARDPRPNLSSIQQTDCQGQNGKTVSGTAYIYRSGLNQLIVRLEDLTMTSVTRNLMLRIYLKGNMIAPIELGLKGYSGSQNYFISTPIQNQTVSSIAFFSPINQLNDAVCLFPPSSP